MSLFLEDERKLRESDVTLALSVYIATMTQFRKIPSVKVRLYFYFEDFIYVQKKAEYFKSQISKSPKFIWQAIVWCCFIQQDGLSVIQTYHK